MPELPEVETIRRKISPLITGSPISGISGSRPTLDQGLSVSLKWIRDHRITGTSRHGKYLFAGLDSGVSLVFHFGMTGDLRFLGPRAEDPHYCRAAISFHDGARLVFTDPRRFGRISFAKGKESFLRNKRIGPDALSLTKAITRRIVLKSRRRIKLLLLDQHRLAGIGNIYADEILFQAGIHPLRMTEAMGNGEVDHLHRSIRSVLKTAVSLSADIERYPGTWLIPHRACGESCPVCGGPVDRVMVAGRYAYFCPSCQT